VNQQVMEDLIRDMALRRHTVLFSTHVMEHAERLCDRILLVARGRLIFDGSMAEAKGTVPRRVRVETEDDIAPLRGLAEVSAARPMAQAGGQVDGQPRRPGCWELELREDSDPQVILQTCFAQGIRLRSFNQSEPTLHEVFMRLVGPEAKEVTFR
jgi:ABC-2 type transport system ATP-binding protein